MAFDDLLTRPNGQQPPSGEPRAPMPLPPPPSAAPAPAPSPSLPVSASPPLPPPAPQIFTPPPGPAPTPQYRALDYNQIQNPAYREANRDAVRAQASEEANAARLQERQQRAAIAAQKTAAREAKTQAREAETLRKEQEREAQRQRNAALERQYRTEDRPFYTDPHSNIVPLHPDADWPGVKKKREDEKTEKARVDSLRDQIAAVDAEMGDPQRKLLSQDQRTTLSKQLASATRDAVNATLIPRLTPTSQQTDKAGWYDVVNNNPTPEATAAQQRLQSLTDRLVRAEEDKSPVDLDDTDLADLDATSPETATKIRTLKQQLAADEENRTWQQERAQRKFDLDLRMRAPQEWERRQRESLSAITDPEALQAEAQRRGTDLEARITDFQTRQQSMVDQQTALATEHESLMAENEQAIAAGLAPHEVATLVAGDGTLQTWRADLAQRLQDLDGRARSLQEQQEPALRALQAEAAALDQDRTLMEEAGQQARVRSRDRTAQQRQRLRQNPSLAPVADALDTMDADLESRVQVVREMYPEGGAEAEAALQALREEHATGINTATQQLQQKYEAGAKYYTTGEGSDLTEPEKTYWTNYFTRADFTKGNTEDPTRVLPDGSVRLNPSLWTDPAKAKAEIEKSGASPEAKKAALAQLPDLEKAGYEALLPAMRDVPGFHTFAKQHRSEVLLPGEWNLDPNDPNDQAFTREKLAGADYKDAASLIKAFREGPGKSWWKNQAGQIAYGLMSGAAGLIQQGAGLWSAATGSPDAQKMASDVMRAQERIAATSQAMQGGQLTGKVSAGAVSILPSLLGGYVTGPLARLAAAGRFSALTRAGVAESQALKAASKLAERIGLGGAAGAAGMQSFGSTFAEAEDAYLAQGLKPEEARGRAMLAATVSGLTTLGITYGFGATGVEAFLKDGKALLKGIGLGTAARVVKGALSEAPEEGLDQYLQGLIQQATYNPNKTFRQIVQESLEAATIGGVLGGGMGVFTGGGPSESTAAATTRFTPEALAAAEQEIAGLSLPNLSPEQLAATQKGARALLAVAQGNFASLTDDQLAVIDLKRNAKGELENILPTGRPPRVKVENGNPIITQPTLDRLEASFPTVRRLIGMNESEARQFFQNPPSASPLSQSPQSSPNPAPAPASTTSPAPASAGPATGQPRGISPQAGASPAASGGGHDARAQGAVPASPAGTAPASAFTPEQSERADLLTTFLTERDVEEPVARAFAEAHLRERGITDPDYRIQAARDLVPFLRSLGGNIQGRPGNNTQALAALQQYTGAASAGSGTGPVPAVSNPGAAPSSPPSPASPAPDLLSSPAWQEQRRLTLSTIQGKDPLETGTKRKRAIKALEILDRQVARYGVLFPGGVRLADEARPSDAESIASGGGLWVEPGDMTMVLHLPTFVRNFAASGKKVDPNAIQAVVEEEVIHLATLNLFTTEELADLWKRLPQDIRDHVWKAYFALPISEGKMPPTPPDLSDPWAANMSHEFLRQLVQDSAFRGRVTESQDVYPKLAQKVIEFLRTLAKGLRALIQKAPAGIKSEIQEYERKTTEAVKAMVATVDAARAPQAKGPASNQVTLSASDLTAGNSRLATPSVAISFPAVQHPIRDKAVLGSTGTAYTDQNDPIAYQWAVVSLDDVVISNDDQGRINPSYPTVLQPRDRTSAGSEAQVNDIAQNANFDRLSTSNQVSDGAPILGDDAVVESGNGRLMGLRRAFLSGLPSSDTYRDALMRRAAEFGLDPEAVKKVQRPALVRIRTTPLDMQQRVAFTQAANVSVVAPMREAEVARKDASNLSPPILSLFSPDDEGNLLTASNAEFLRAFVRDVVPPAERPGVVDAAGNLSQSGLRRVRNALFVSAYGDSPGAMSALARLAESTDDSGRNLISALTAAAPGFAEQKARMAAGALHQSLDLTPDIVAAVAQYQDLKTSGTSVADHLDQGQLGGGVGKKVSPTQRLLLRTLSDNARSAKTLREVFARYQSAVEGAGDPRQGALFGDQSHDKDALLNLVLGAARPSTSALSAGRRMPAPSAASTYKRLFALEQSGQTLKPTQRQAMELAEQSLGQHFFSFAEKKTLAPAADLHLETEIALDTRKAVQMPLFAGRRTPIADPRITEQFGDWKYGFDEYGLPNPPRTLPDDDPLLQNTKEKKTARLRSDHPLVKLNLLPADQDLPRKALQRAILQYFLRDAQVLPDGTQPTVFATGGGGGAGKSTILKILRKRGLIDTSGAVLVNADDIKELIPEYQALKDAGDGRGAAVVHEESSQIAKNLIDRLLDPKSPRYNFIYDATLANGEGTQRHFARWKASGYRIHLAGVTIDPLEAMIRAVLRGAGSGRWVPTHMLAEAHAGFNRWVKAYLDFVDLANLYDNTPPDPHEIARKSAPNEPISVVNEEFWSIIDSRSHEENRASVSDENLREGDRGREGGGEGGGQTALRETQPGSPESGSPGASRIPQGPSERVAPPLSSSRRRPEQSLAVDLSLQSSWLADSARRAGFDSFEALFAAEPSQAQALMRRWRARHVRNPDGSFGTDDGLVPLAATLASSRRAPTDDSLQLGLFDFLAPAQVEKKKAQPSLRPKPAPLTSSGQSATVSPPDLFSADENTRPNSQRAGGSLPPSRGSAPAAAAESAGDLFGVSGMAGEPAGAGFALRPGGQRGSRGTRRTDTPGGVVAGDPQAGADASALPGSGEDLPGQRGDAGDDAAHAAPVKLERPDPGTPSRNFAPPADLSTLAPAGNRGKIEANLAAIDLLKKLESERRNATAEEKRALAAYTGWGAFKEAFNDGQADAREHWRNAPSYHQSYKPSHVTSWEKNWGPLHDILKERMSPAEYRAASRSTLNAHFTAAPVIRAMWSMVERLGFKGGRALEPSAGAGHYLGLQPQGAIADATEWQTVELDELTARLLSKLYPEAVVNESLGGNEERVVDGLGFERARIPNGSLDLIISNVPFHESGPRKKGFPNLNLHNFFFAHALDKVKPGGLVAFITSASTMQNNQKQRDFIASKGDLVAAFRLPNNAFKENAGTEVVTDILIFRKPDGTPFKGESWRSLAEAGRQTITLTQGKDQTADELRREAKSNGTILREHSKDGVKAIDVDAPILVNEYFLRHPEHVLGSHSLQGSMYRGNEYTVTAPEGFDTAATLARLVSSLPENIMGRRPAENAGAALADRADRPFSYVERDGKIWEVQDDGTMQEAEWTTNDKMVRTFRSWLRVKDAVRALIREENDPGATEESLAPLRRDLNRVYDSHIATYGPISRRFGNQHTHLYSDPEYPLTAALETEAKVTDSTGKVKWTYPKAAIFKQRMIKPIAPPSRAKDFSEALQISLAWRGMLDVQHMAGLLGTTTESVYQQARENPDVFLDPVSLILETRESYLSGNLRRKLDEAESATEDDPQYRKNVEALREAMPARRSIGSVTPVLGARWIPKEVYNAFIRETLQGHDEVEYIPAGNMWRMSGTHLFRNQEYSTDKMGTHELFETLMDMQEPMIYWTDRDGKRHFDAVNTAAAKAAGERMKRAFVEFVKTSTVPAFENTEGENTPVWQLAENAYNDTNNSYVTPSHKGDFLQFPGLSEDVWRTPHRRAVIARFLAERRGMMAHGVGSGKTFNQIILAQELRRLGLARKPLIVVQNSTLGQFAASYLQAYPSAKVLVPTERDLQTQNRRKLVSKIATGDWDAVILSHSQFDLIANKPEAVKEYMGEKIDELKGLILAAKGGDKSKVRDLEGMLKKLEDRLASMLDALKARQDGTIFWEDLGVDALIVDEAHNYKSVPIVTRMGRIKGIPASSDSQRAIGMLLKARHVQSKTGGKNVFLATGTPVKNSMAEAYIMMEICAPDVLRDYQIHNFDDFATTFGRVESATEISWSGSPKVESRFAKFQNGRELVTMIRSAFDVAMGNEKLGLKVPKVKTGAPELRIVEPTPTIDQFNAWVRHVADLWKQATGKEKEEFTAVPIMTLQAGIVAALDPRLISPSAPDHADSKVNTAIREVVRLHKAGTPKRTTQLIFADLRRPFNMDYLSRFAGHPFPDHGSGGDFDLFQDIGKKLIAAGIPEKEIGIVDPSLSKKQRLALFEKVDAGEVRVVLGSTETLGVGVNVQTRLKAVHHLMPPRDFTPAMMEQRNGRVIRQGNLHEQWGEEVEVLQYGTEGSMDSAVYGTLARKQRFITQLLMGDLDSDTFDDPTDPVAVNLAEMAARTMGDPDFIRRIEVEKELRDLRLEADAFTSELSSRRSRLSQARRQASELPGTIQSLRTLREKIGSMWTRTAPRPEGVKPETDISDKAVYQFGDRTIDTATKEGGIMGPLDLWLLDRSKTMERQGKKTLAQPFLVNDTALTVEVETTMEGSSTPGRVLREGRELGRFSGASGLLRVLHEIPRGLSDATARHESSLTSVRTNIEQLEALLNRDTTFPRQSELDALEQELQDVDARLRAKAQPPAPATPKPTTETPPAPLSSPAKVPSRNGRSQPGDSLIRLADGSTKRMDHLGPEDVLLAADGSPQGINGIYPQGVLPVYDLTLSDGTTAQFSEDHLFLAKLDDPESPPFNLRLRDIMKFREYGRTIYLPVMPPTNP